MKVGCHSHTGLRLNAIVVGQFRKMVRPYICRLNQTPTHGYYPALQSTHFLFIQSRSDPIMIAIDDRFY